MQVFGVTKYFLRIVGLFEESFILWLEEKLWFVKKSEESFDENFVHNFGQILGKLRQNCCNASSMQFFHLDPKLFSSKPQTSIVLSTIRWQRSFSLSQETLGKNLRGHQNGSISLAKHFAFVEKAFGRLVFLHSETWA